MLVLTGLVGVVVALLLAGAAGGAADLAPVGRPGPVEYLSTVPGLALDPPTGTPARAVALARSYLAASAVAVACLVVGALAWLQAQIPVRVDR